MSGALYLHNSNTLSWRGA